MQEKQTTGLEYRVTLLKLSSAFATHTAPLSFLPIFLQD